MATNTIKGLTVEIGGDTTNLGKALESVNKKTRDLTGELGQINKLLKLDPGNTELLAQKQTVLAEAVSNTREKLEKLKEAEKQVQKQFEKGEVSEEQVRALQREIIDTTKKLDGYEKAAKETAEAVERLGEESEDAADEMKDVSKQADKAEDSAEELGDTLDGTTSLGFAAVTAAATAAVGAIVGCIEASEDYRREMGKLETAFETNGFSSETATTAYKDLQKIIGETDQTVEAVNHLAALVDTEEELAHWTGDILPGVYARFGASLQPEALTEAANETARTGQVTGALADALNWAIDPSEDFGLALKDNIKFTKKSAKELEEMTDEQIAEYEARLQQYEAIEEYNTQLTEAVTAEDKFNIALANCTTEQERQQLITDVLTKTYKGAADQYKKTNKEVIRSNEATEEWNATVADLGAEMAPVMTDIKEFGVTLLKNAKEPLKDVAGFISDKLLPALTGIGTWISNNKPIIVAALTAVTTAFVAYKAAVIATEVAQKGLKGAIMATEAAQKLLNIAQAATPLGLLTAAVVAITAAVVAYEVATNHARDGVDGLTTAEQELLRASQETAEELKQQRAASDEAAEGALAQMDHVTKLAEELQTLADASGKVQEKDQARAQYILGELNEALGTEYTMTDGVIQKYDELQGSIYQVIAAKTANALLDAYNEEYVASIQAEASLLEGLNLANKDYQAQLEVVNAKESEVAEVRKKLAEETAKARETGDYRSLQSLGQTLMGLELSLDAEKDILKKKEDAYYDAAYAYGENATMIANYDDAQTAALEGNYGAVKDLLVDKSYTFSEFAEGVDEDTAKVLDALYKEAIDAGVEAHRMRTNFEKGVAGYTQDMVDEADQAYEDALAAFENAHKDAYGVGEDLGGGLQSGLEGKEHSLVTKAKNIVSNIISAMKKEADSNSPSKKTMALGEDMGEGTEIGIEEKTKDVTRAAQKQMSAVLDAYRAEESLGQQTLRNLSSPVAHEATTGGPMDGLVAGLLGDILTAIKEGQVLTIDGKKLVGATATDMDNRLGQRRLLAERGAL